MDNRFGKCRSCGTSLEPVWFKKTEYQTVEGRRSRTGRMRTACSHLVCPICMTNECVDDSFDGPWKCE